MSTIPDSTRKASTTPSLTKEAVDDSKEAAHGADHRGNDLISPLNLLVTPQPHLSQTQQLAGGSHGDCSEGERWRLGEPSRAGLRGGGDVQGMDWISGPQPLCLPANRKHRGKVMERERAGVRMNERKTEERVIIDCSF